jgi:hypothetical protein
MMMMMTTKMFIIIIIIIIIVAELMNVQRVLKMRSVAWSLQSERRKTGNGRERARQA